MKIPPVEVIIGASGCTGQQLSRANVSDHSKKEDSVKPGRRARRRPGRTRLSTRGKLLASGVTLLLVLGLLEGVAWVVDGWTSFQGKLQAALMTAGKINVPIAAQKSIPLPGAQIYIRGLEDGGPGEPHRVAGKVIVAQVNHPQVIALSPDTVLEQNKKSVFAVGGSAAFGFVYNSRDIYTTKLHRKLSGRGYRVYNAAYPGWTSGQVVPIARRIVDHYRPHTLVIFCGNNEWIRWDGLNEERLAARRLRAYRLASRSYFLSGLVYWSLKRSQAGSDGGGPGRVTYAGLKGDEPLLGIEHTLENPLARYARFDAEDWKESKQLYLATFEANLLQMVRQAQKKRVRVILLTVPFNYKLSPSFFHPQPESFDPAQAQAVRRSIREVARLVKEQKYQQGRRQAQAALALDPLPPVLNYLHGICLEQLGQMQQAEAAYARSRENTIGGLGSRLSVNRTIARVARATGAELVDVQKIFNAHGRSRGRHFNELLIDDSCHPNPLGNTLVAEALARLFD